MFKRHSRKNNESAPNRVASPIQKDSLRGGQDTIFPAIGLP